MYPKALLIPLFVIFLFSSETNCQTITRGPYLQLGTTTSIFIHWRTDSQTDTKVWYGDDPSNLDQTLSSPGNVTDHEIIITGLSPNTTYYYAVGDSNGQMAGADADHFFITSPSSNQIIRAWVLGDAGKKNDDQRAVRDGYYDYIGNQHIDMILALGDNAYNDGDDDDYQFGWFENMYEDKLIKSVIWPTFGNHDGNSSDSPTQTGPYYDIFNLPKNAQAGGVSSGTEAYYSFDYGNTHIVCLNSHDIDASANSDMIQWLQDDVDANTKEWLIAMFHHPAYRGQIYDIEANALPILEGAGVDLVLWGHYHRYERSFLINGHYGSSGSYDPATMTIDDGDGRLDGDGAYSKNNNGEGTIYVNTGSAGLASSGSSSHPIMAYNAGILGSVHLEINDSQVDVKFIDTNGNIEDYFTIIKQNGPPTIAITNPLDNDYFPVPETISITADATDSNGTISKVEFFIDNVSIGSDFTAPYSKSWTIPQTGSFEIKATATDNDDLSSSDIINIQVGDGIACASVNSSSDDAEEDTSGGINLTSGDLELIQESTVQIVGIRFTNLNIPQGATIDLADIQFTCDKDANINPCVLDIYAEAIDDAPSFSSNDFNISNRTKTSATASWSPADWLNIGDAGPDQKTIDISPIIQEVVDRPGFTTNSSIVIIIEGTGKREAESYNGSVPGAPELCVEFSEQGPLPIELLSFNAQAIDKKIKLSWATASEINNDFFTLERSVDGHFFRKIKVISGNGNSSEIIEYNYFDEQPKDGINYYRLKQTDFDGQFAYSKVVQAEINTQNHFLVYPSKFEDFIIIEKAVEAEDAEVVIIDITGRILKTFLITDHEIKKNISLEDLIPGIYFVSIHNNFSVKTFKIIKI